jgi:hypothetical protein
VWNFVTITGTLFLPKFQHTHEEKNFIIIIKIEWNDNGNNKMEVNDYRKWGGGGRIK